MSPILADGIDFPIALGVGLLVLIPLMAFEVFVEAYILKLTWKLAFRRLCLFTLVANLWSLAAGIPTKIVNAFLYGLLLPQDLPGFFGRYSLAVGIGTLIYFGVTLAVEGAYAFRWLRRQGQSLQRGLVWKGVLLANLASYAVVAPLHYFATRPMSQIREFTNDTHWCAHPTNTICFVAQGSENLETIRLDGSGEKKVLPFAITDYLVSADLKLCLFRSPAGNLCLWHATGETNVVLRAKERFNMNQVAFSPSGNHVAFADKESEAVEVVEVPTGKYREQALPSGMSECFVAWSMEETRFFVSSRETNAVVEVFVQPGAALKLQTLEGTNSLPLLPCYGRVGSDSEWFGESNWGLTYDADACGDLKVRTEHGLGSGLSVYRNLKEPIAMVHLYVNPGLFHVARFNFEDTVFLEGCQECLFSANDYIYLLDIPAKRVGTVARGDRFIMLTPRYQKHL